MMNLGIWFGFGYVVGFVDILAGWKGLHGDEVWVQVVGGWGDRGIRGWAGGWGGYVYEGAAGMGWW